MEKREYWVEKPHNPDNWQGGSSDMIEAFPEGPQGLGPVGEIEEQTVLSQTFHLAMDTDNNNATGGSGHGVLGVDLDFGIRAFLNAGCGCACGDRKEKRKG